jgi:methyl-accepting chemotaxis protein
VNTLPAALGPIDTTGPAPAPAAAFQRRAPRAPRQARGDAPAAAVPRARGDLKTHIAAGAAAVGVLQVLLLGLVAASATGPLRIAALTLGAVVLLAVGGGAAWLLRAVVAPALGASGAAARMSAGNLTQPIASEHGGELRPLLQALEEVRQRLVSVVSQVRTGTTSVAMNSSQITRDNVALSERTTTQAESLQQTAATMEQMTAAVRQNADTTQQAHELVRSASSRAEQGAGVMAEVVDTMGSIRDSSQSIREIIGVIDGIAFQTNILALNAAVEAARAGDQGRGFAVVAGEVRTLAQRSASAAREIRTLIGSSVEKVELGGQRVDEAGRSMGEIVTAVRGVAQLMAQIDAATREQSAGIESINEAVSRIDRTTQANGELVNDATRTAAALHERAVALMKGVALFDLGGSEHGTADEARQLVRAGCDFHRTHGRAALIAEVNKLAQGRFVDRDLYLMVIGADNSVFLAHGNNPRTLGSGPNSRDVDGRRFVLTMTETARRHGEGWVDYKWAHPVTNEVLVMSSFVKKVGDVVVACGVYR